MHRTLGIRLIVAGIGLLGSGLCAAQEAPDKSPVTWFIGQRFWAVSMDVKLEDSAVVLPDPTKPAPVVKTQFKTGETSGISPITSLGARYGNFSASLSVLPKTSMAAPGFAAGGKITRSEYDLSVGYFFLPTMSISLIYKSAKASPSVTETVYQALGMFGDQKGRGVLLGLSANAPLAERLSLYGNIAYGPARWEVDGVQHEKLRSSARYTVAEVGLAYRLVDPGTVPKVSAVTLQLGYRIQQVNVYDVELGTYSLSLPPQKLSSEFATARPFLQGLVLGISAAF